MTERKYKPEFAQALVGSAGHVDHGKRDVRGTPLEPFGDGVNTWQKLVKLV